MPTLLKTLTIQLQGIKTTTGWCHLDRVWIGKSDYLPRTEDTVAQISTTPGFKLQSKVGT